MEINWIAPQCAVIRNTNWIRFMGNNLIMSSNLTKVMGSYLMMGEAEQLLILKSIDGKDDNSHEIKKRSGGSGAVYCPQLAKKCKKNISTYGLVEDDMFVFNLSDILIKK